MKIIDAVFASGAVDARGYPSNHLPEIAFVGRSNVGKSSLLNSLLNRGKLARTSNTPGRTQQINFFLINKAFYFVDLPGYGYAKLSKVQRQQLAQMLEKYLAQRDELVLSILLIDSRHMPTEMDQQTKSWFEQYAKPFQVVLTKSDKLSNNELRNQLNRIKTVLGTDQIIPYSSVTGLGQDKLWSAITARMAEAKQQKQPSAGDAAKATEAETSK